MTSELEKRAEEEIGATYESELPAECVPKKPDMTVALVKYMKRLFYAGADYGAKAERERIWNDIASELIVMKFVSLEDLKRVIFEEKK
ncbi:MAG: hypothetical protein E6Q97_13250 [Desulfurellales bacterium]|nr:MAG: hypothetical protein E6Q97_13250 [Desulfurellales bacterium]